MRFFSVLMPVIGLAIIFGEAGITYAGMFHPQVDRYYRAFYIDGYESCWLTPTAAAAAKSVLLTNEIAINKLDPSTACSLLARGWSSLERWGVWSSGNIAALVLPREPGKNRLDIRLIGYSPRNQQVVKVYLNDHPLGSFFVPSTGPSDLLLDVPPTVSGDITILFRIKHPRKPPILNGHKDNRHLGIGLISIKWE
jgi:hypothetical protein